MFQVAQDNLELLIPSPLPLECWVRSKPPCLLYRLPGMVPGPEQLTRVLPPPASVLCSSCSPGCSCCLWLAQTGPSGLSHHSQPEFFRCIKEKCVFNIWHHRAGGNYCFGCFYLFFQLQWNPGPRASRTSNLLVGWALTLCFSCFPFDFPQPHKNAKAPAW